MSTESGDTTGEPSPPSTSAAEPRRPSLSAALLAGTLAALVTALPAVPRATDHGAPAIVALLALVGGSSLVLGPALACVCAVPSMTSSLRIGFVALAFASAPIAWFGTLLKLNTHHRPLGAATFAVVALVVLLSASLVVARLMARQRQTPLSRIAELVLIGAAAASLALTLYWALASTELVVHVLDGLRAFATLVFAWLALRFAAQKWTGRSTFARAGAPVWVALVVAGIVTGAGSSSAGAKRAAPVLAGPLAWL